MNLIGNIFKMKFNIVIFELTFKNKIKEEKK